MILKLYIASVIVTAIVEVIFAYDLKRNYIWLEKNKRMITATLPVFVPVLNILIALVTIFNYESMIKTLIDQGKMKARYQTLKYEEEKTNYGKY